MAVGGYFALTPPKPQANALGPSRQSLRDTQAATVQAAALATKAEGELHARTWDLRPDALGTRMMDDLTRLTGRRRVVLANFSSGRMVIGAGLRQLPFTVTLEGAFSDVLAAMDDLERPESRLALGNVAITPKEAAGEAPGRVAATLVLTAFLRGEG